MIAGAGRLAEVSVDGLRHYEGTYEPQGRKVLVALVQSEAGGPSVYVGTPGGSGDAYEVPVSVLKTALQALPLRELLRVLREARG